MNPLDVACPDCQAPTGEGCRVSEGWPDGTLHAARIDSARLRSVEHGTCALCTRPLVRGVRTEGEEETVWHPDPTDAALCPPLPDPQTHWNAYAEAHNRGLRPGYPGAEHFNEVAVNTYAVIRDASKVTPEDLTGFEAAVSRPLCPECTQGKTINCAGLALVGDDLIPCATTETPRAD